MDNTNIESVIPGDGIQDSVSDTLAEHFLQPSRPYLSVASKIAENYCDPKAAWHTLIEEKLIPEEFSQSPKRKFCVLDLSRRYPLNQVESIERYLYPPTISAVITFGSDANQMLEAEKLAIELGRRLEPWGGKAGDDIEWFCLSHKRPISLRFGPAFDCALYSLQYVLEEMEIEPNSLSPDHPQLPQFVNDVVRANVGWERAIEEELEVPGAYWPPSQVKWKLFSELLNPFEPVISLWQTGYVTKSSFFPDDPIIRFYTFQVDAPLLPRPKSAFHRHQ
ncbi:hypothetical protein MC7420_281 [Coleofasciculus chthonoplastes PCC 7420]|uniref:Uncharacterized protein n=1 Tax=Coleofasciculus chthonoplastes PCC 7420 TaxID=118168 RepID=B4VL70_9CYAN|nr:hypothetical protein MC7420_281 [Coleofasciculus chthonoplastes PCC 7420]